MWERILLSFLSSCFGINRFFPRIKTPLALTESWREEKRGESSSPSSLTAHHHRRFVLRMKITAPAKHPFPHSSKDNAISSSQFMRLIPCCFGKIWAHTLLKIHPYFPISFQNLHWHTPSTQPLLWEQIRKRKTKWQTLRLTKGDLHIR